MKRIKIILWIELFSMLIFSISYATKPQKPSLKMEMSIIHDDNWEAGKESKVTFRFKPLQDVPRKAKHPDEAQVYIDSGLVLVSGSPNWSGFLEKGQEYSISVVLRPTHGGKFVLGLGVEASLTRVYTDEEIRKKEEEYDKRIERSPELKKMGIRGKGAFAKKTFFYHNGTSTVIDVLGAIPASEIWRNPATRPKPTIPLDSLLKIKVKYILIREGKP